MGHGHRALDLTRLVGWVCVWVGGEGGATFAYTTHLEVPFFGGCVFQNSRSRSGHIAPLVCIHFSLFVYAFALAMVESVAALPVPPTCTHAFFRQQLGRGATLGSGNAQAHGLQMSCNLDTPGNAAVAFGFA